VTPADAEEYTQALGQVVAGSWRQIALGQRLGVPQALNLTVKDWVTQRLGGYVRVSVEERKAAVLELRHNDLTLRDIGAVLGVDPMTVLHDLRPVENSTRTPTPQQVADLEEAQARSREIDRLRLAQPEQFAGDEIRSVLTFAFDEFDKWVRHAQPIGKTTPKEWAVLNERCVAVTAFIRRMCEATRIDSHRTDAGEAAQRGHQAAP